MGNSEEETSANKPAAVADKRKGSEIHVEPEGSSRLETLPVGGTLERPESSNHAYLSTLEGDPLIRYKMSLANCGPAFKRHCPVKGSVSKIDELKSRNSRIPTSLTTEEGMNHRQEYQWPPFYHMEGSCKRNSNGNLISSGNSTISLNGENIQRISFGLQELKSFSIKQNNEAPDEISNHFTCGYDKITSSDKLPPGNKWYNILCSSDCSKYSPKRGPKDEHIKSESPEWHMEIHAATAVHTNKEWILPRREAPDAMLNGKASLNQSSLDNISVIEPKLSHNGISLRHWLDSGCSEMNKIERLRLFRKIVQIVDIAHSQSIVLQDLRPSSFILVQNEVIYIGSSAQVELTNSVNLEVTRKEANKLEMHCESSSDIKRLKLVEDLNSTRYLSQILSRWGFNNAAANEIDSSTACLLNNHSENKHNYSHNEDKCIQPHCHLEPDVVQLEKKWYSCPNEINDMLLLSSNIYSLGVIMFELLSHFESAEMQSAAMLDLHQRILPPEFLSQNPKEAGFCFWLLHPEPSSRPTARKILQLELLNDCQELHLRDDSPSCNDKDDDPESELLLYFLVSLKEQKQHQASTLLQRIGYLEADIKEVEKRNILGTSGIWIHNDSQDSVQASNFREILKEKLRENIGQLEDAYFCMRSQINQTDNAAMEREDKDLLTHRERLLQAQTESDPAINAKPVDQVGGFFESICKFARYSKFEVCGTLRDGDLLNSANVICSLSFDREEDYVAAAGVSKKIKIFELSSFLHNSSDIQYPVSEMLNNSKFSCVCWNNYIKNYLASTDYDGVVQMWDASTGQGFCKYIEHKKRAWSVDFSRVDPTKFASGSDDCSVKLWSINERNSVGTIWSPANVCCVQFSAHSSNLLVFGSADYKLYCYDLRNTRIPWCTLAGHKKAVSYVKFLDSESIVSASTDNTLKLWDLKKTSLEGLSSNACSMTFTGHTNEKNFVGLTVADGYIACGSETNEVYAYYRSLPMAITSYKFGPDPNSGADAVDNKNRLFVSSVCWRRKSNMLVAANSTGSVKLLQMV